MKIFLSVAALIGCVLLLSQCNEYVPTSAPHIDMSTPQQLTQTHKEVLEQMQRHREMEWTHTLLEFMFWLGIPALALCYGTYLQLKRQAYQCPTPNPLNTEELEALRRDIQNKANHLLTHQKNDEDKP